MRQRLGGAVWVIGAVALPLIALIQLLSLIDDSVDALDPPTPALSVPTEEAPLDLSIEASLVVEFGNDTAIRAPESWNGLVTSVDVVPGQDVVSGTPVVSINGVRRLAIQTPAPFYRSLELRDKGPEVMMLQQVLGDLGVFDGQTDGQYGTQTERAVRDLSRSLGTDSKVFDPSWFIWLPVSSLTAGTVDLQVGDVAPSTGTTLLTAERPVLRITLEAPTNPVPLISSFTFTSQNSGTVDVGWQAGRWTITTPDDTLRLALQLDLLTDEDLFVLEGRLRPANEVTTIQVPSSAVTSGTSGNVCVWIPRADAWVPIDVEVVWSTPFGQSQLAPGSSLETVLGNPREYLLGGASCP